MSRVDVVIPCYNYGKFLTECVTGALDDQPCTDVRILIIDDASQDDSAEIARKLAGADDRIEVRVHSVNRGHIASYNEGLLDWADGDYCVLISADDVLAPGALNRAADLMDAHPEVGFVYGKVVRFADGEKLPPARTTSCPPTIWPGRWWLEQRFEEAHTCIFSPEVVVRTSVQHQVGGYNANLYHTADHEMWLRLAAHADVGFVHADQAYKRRHDNMMSGVVDDLLHLNQLRAAYRGSPEELRRRAAQCGRAFRRRASRAGEGGPVESPSGLYDRRQTDRVPVDELVTFAFDCWPAAASLSTYRSLQCVAASGPPSAARAAAAPGAPMCWLSRAARKIGGRSPHANASDPHCTRRLKRGHCGRRTALSGYRRSGHDRLDDRRSARRGGCRGDHRAGQPRPRPAGEPGQALASGRVRLEEGDIRDTGLVRRLMSGIDVVFHQAAIRITQCASEPRLALEVLVDGTYEIVEAAADAGVRKVVAASSASVYGLADHFPTTERQHPYANDTLYGAAKTFNEGLLRSFHAMRGLDYVALRYFNVYGPRMDIHGLYTEVLIRWMERIEAGQPPLILGDGTADDGLRLYRGHRPGEPAGRGQRRHRRGVQHRQRHRDQPHRAGEALQRAMGSDLGLEFGPPRGVNGVTRRLADTSAAARRLGWKAEIGLDEGLSRLVAWWRDQR